MNHDLASEIRSKVDIVDIIGEKIPLVSHGKNFWGVCPFHDDKNPSLCVSRERQIYTCFSCHATGNAFTFVMEYDHMDFPSALKYLGEKVGVDVGNIKVAKKNDKTEKIYDAYLFATKYFQNNLLTKLGKKAKEYLASRKIDDAIIKEFEIGLSLEKKDDLTSLLMKKGYDIGMLNKIGLSADNHDIYCERIMFPLYDVNGRIVGFSGRIYKGKSQSKYVNTKETEIFKKGETLYHYHIAREECRLKKNVIVMEGFMDVIRASTIGVRNTVALMGTALTKQQIQLLKRLSPNIILCLDGDDPGVKATLSVGNLLLEEKVEVKVIPLPKEYDPDTYILEFGQEKFLSLMDSAIHFNDFKIQKLKETVDFRSDEETANYIHMVLEETAKLEDEIRIEVILKKLAKEFDIGYNTLEMRLQRIKQEKLTEKESQKIVVAPPPRKRKNKYDKAVEQLLFFMLHNDWVIDQAEKEFLVLPAEEHRILCSEIIYYYKKYGKIELADFYTYLQEKPNLLSLLNRILTDHYEEHTTQEELPLYFKVIREYGRKQEIKRLTTLMKKEVNPLEQAELVEKMRKLRIGED